MFDIKEFGKIINNKAIYRANALPEKFVLKNGTYEIIELQEVSDKTYIYKGINLKTERFVTIKELFPQKAIDFEEQMYFSRNIDTGNVDLKDPSKEKQGKLVEMINHYLDEAKFIGKISYGDSILKVHECFQDNNTAYVIMNFNESPSLDDLLKSDYSFSNTEIDWIFKSLLTKIEDFHKKAIVHRNLNPKNIYIMDSEIVIDSLGCCDFIKDINIHEKDSYQNNYYAPEVITHDDEVGTWTDVYAIGKILIELISSKADSEDYFDGLKTLSDKDTIEKYHEVIEKSISFYSKDRIQDAIEMKNMFYPELPKKSIYRSSKAFVAVIALLAIMSSAYVLSISQKTAGYDIVASEDVDDEYIVIPDEETPLAAPNTLPGASGDVINGFRFVTEPFEILKINEEMIIKWNISPETFMKKIEVDENNYDLEEKQTIFDLSHLKLETGNYILTLYYEYLKEPTKKKIIIKVEE